MFFFFIILVCFRFRMCLRFLFIYLVTHKTLSLVQTAVTLLANNSQHRWMLHVASVCKPCCMLLDVVACCCAKFETSQNFSANNSQHFVVPWSLKRSATILDPFAQLFQHCWGHAHALYMVYKDLWVVSFPRCTVGPKIVPTLLGVCIRLHTTANKHATTPNIVGATMLGVVTSVLHAALYSVNKSC